MDRIEVECIGGEGIDITPEKDGGLMKYIMVESKSRFQRCCEEADTVHYFHETRYENGQLVDLDEKRKVKDKFEMDNLQQHEHIRRAFFTMKKGEISWIRIGTKYHNDIYQKFCKQDHIAKDAVIGKNIWIKLSIDSIKRSPLYKDKDTYSGKCLYYETCRIICKELVEEQEFANAQTLYSRCLGEFKNMPKKIQNSLTEQ